MQYKFKENNTKFLSLIPSITIMLGIFYISHQSQVPQIYLLTTLEDKIQHFIAFFTLGVCIQFYLMSLNLSFKKIMIITIFFGSLYGVSDEFHQSFVVGRYVEVLDWVADTVGTVASLSIYKLIKYIFNKIFLKIER
jgi:VanZ family protein